MVRVFIADPSLKDHRGHHFGLSETISDNCTAHGFEIIWLVNNQFRLSLKDRHSRQIRPVFTSTTYDGHKLGQTENHRKEFSQDNSSRAQTFQRRITFLCHRNANRFIPNLRKMGKRISAKFIRLAVADATTKSYSPAGSSTEQELYRVLREHDANAEDMVLFHTCDAETYRDTVELFVNEVPIERWNSLPAVHLSTPYDEAIMPHNDRILGFEHSVRRLSNLGLIGTRVFLHAENVLLAEHLANYLGVEVSPLPIPPFKPIHSKSARASMDVMNVMYLGAARTEKGFVVLPDVVSQCLKKGLKVRFTIQVTPQILGYTPDIERAVQLLKKIDDPRVKLLEEPLSQQDYKRTLSHADIVLLCYQPDRYAVRSSGIAVEAVLSEATIIATQNTFPAFLSGDAGIQISDAADIVDAITRVARNREGYQISARARRQWYLNQYGSEAFMSALVRHKCQDINTTDAFATHKFEDSTKWRSLI